VTCVHLHLHPCVCTCICICACTCVPVSVHVLVCVPDWTGGVRVRVRVCPGVRHARASPRGGAVPCPPCPPPASSRLGGSRWRITRRRRAGAAGQGAPGPQRGGGGRGRDGGRGRGRSASASRGEKFPTRRARLRSFGHAARRQSQANTAPAWTRRGATARSPTGKLRRGARGVAAQGHREEPQPVREANSLDPRAERENPERAAGRDHPGTKSCSPRRVAATLSPTSPQGLAKPDPDLTHRLSSGARASLQKKASTIHDIWDPNVAHPKSHSSNTFLCCETRCPGDSTLLPHQPGEVMRPWVLGQ
jgi:hypothetical protein